MGKVAVTIKVMPKSGSDVKTIEDLIRNQLSIYDEIELRTINERKIAFGLKSLELLIILPDSKGGTDKIEKELSELEGVENVSVKDITLV